MKKGILIGSDWMKKGISADNSAALGLRSRRPTRSRRRPVPLPDPVPPQTTAAQPTVEPERIVLKLKASAFDYLHYYDSLRSRSNMYISKRKPSGRVTVSSNSHPDPSSLTGAELQKAKEAICKKYTPSRELCATNNRDSKKDESDRKTKSFKCLFCNRMLSKKSQPVHYTSRVTIENPI